MGYLLNADWENGHGLDDLKTWGTDRLMHFINLFDERYGAGQDEDTEAVWLYYEMKDILLDMNEVIDRFWVDCNPEAARKRAAREMPRQDSKDRPARLLELISEVPEDKIPIAETYLMALIEPRKEGIS